MKHSRWLAILGLLTLASALACGAEGSPVGGGPDATGPDGTVAPDAAVESSVGDDATLDAGIDGDGSTTDRTPGADVAGDGSPDAATLEASDDGAADAPGDASDATAVDADADAPADSPCGLEDGSVADDAATVYSALADPSKWSAFDITTVDLGATRFIGAAFDGRYAYFVPYQGGGGTVARYDTQATFTAGCSWGVFDAAKVGAGGFSGAAFDGRYVTFVPFAGSVAARYDTQADFGTASSWSTFDLTTVNALAKGYAGGAFDGRYGYFVPNDAGLAARYDTQASFMAAGSWSMFDLTTVNAGAIGFSGAVFDGRFLYFVPYRVGGSGVPRSLVARYDTTAGFTTGTSWSTFDVSGVNALAHGFFGGAFDGRYVYLVPFFHAGSDGGLGASGLAMQYDTQAAFTAAASWSVFDTTTVNAEAKGFVGAAFDGRYVYLVPGANDLGFDGIVARYDSQSAFGAAASWAMFDMATVNAGAGGFVGAAFDGRYLYFVPDENDNGFDGIVMRFDGKTPPALPPGYAHGSFY